MEVCAGLLAVDEEDPVALSSVWGPHGSMLARPPLEMNGEGLWDWLGGYGLAQEMGALFSAA
jgi:hypothetical protein